MHLEHPNLRETTKAGLARRILLVRTERFGAGGGPELAALLDVPVRTWLNYESGVTIPGELLLAFIEATGSEPLWLLRGSGPRYRAEPSRC